MAILSLLAKLGLDKTGFDAGLSAASKQVAGFGKNLVSQFAGAFGAGAMLALARETIKYGDSIKELGERLGITAKEAQLFGLAAELGGSDVEFFATKFDKLKKAMSEAISGGKNPFAAFGLGVEELSKMRPAEVMNALAKQINDVGISADQSVKFVEIFGKGASRMINILGDVENAKSGTLLFSDADVARLSKTADFWTKAVHNARGAFNLFAQTWTAVYRGTAKLDALLMGRKAPAKKATQRIDEDQILTNMEAADEARKTHMAIMDRVLALDKDAAQLEAEAHKAGLTDAERKNELLAERVRLMGTLQKLAGELTPKEEEERANARKRLAEVNLDVARIDQQKANTPARTLAQIESTKLGSIGGGLGNTGAVRTEQIASESLRIQKAMLEQLARRGIVVANWR